MSLPRIQSLPLGPSNGTARFYHTTAKKENCAVFIPLHLEVIFKIGIGALTLIKCQVKGPAVECQTGTGDVEKRKMVVIIEFLET